MKLYKKDICVQWRPHVLCPVSKTYKLLIKCRECKHFLEEHKRYIICSREEDEDQISSDKIPNY